MLEIAVNDNADSKPADGRRQHLSSVNDHRVLLCSVDPTTNFTEPSFDGAVNGECGLDKELGTFDLSISTVQDERLIRKRDTTKLDEIKSLQTDCLGIEEISNDHRNDRLSMISSHEVSALSGKIEELGKYDQVNPLKGTSIQDHVRHIADAKGVKVRCKIAKRRKRAPWGSEYSKRQKNSRRLPRSEMLHEDLLKLREKERKAQQLRRNRLRKSEEVKMKLFQKEACKFASTNMDDSNDIIMGETGVQIVKKDCAAKCDSNDFISSGEKCSNMEDDDKVDSSVDSGEQGKAQDSGTPNIPLDARFCFDGKPHPLCNSAIKENFMRALGLQQRPKAREVSSMAEFLANNVDPNSIDCFDTATSEETCYRTLTPKSSAYDLGGYKFYHSWSEESSDCSDKRINGDGTARRRTRRSNLPKEELERLREKERLAKRRQRAKNKREFQREFDAMKLERNDNSKDLLESMKQNDASSNDMESSMDAESAAGWKDAPGNPSPFTDDDAQKGTVKNEMTDEQKAASVKQIIGKKRAFPRYYDRSLLTAEELERLRRREREYQRRRRARLREAKCKVLGEASHSSKGTSENQDGSNEERKATEDSSKNYETRRSNGISRPSLRFLEHSSGASYESESYPGNTILNEDSNSRWRKNEVESNIDYNTSISMVHSEKFVNHCEEAPVSELNHEPSDVRLEQSSTDQNYDRQISAPALQSTDGSDKPSLADLGHYKSDCGGNGPPTGQADSQRPAVTLLDDEKFRFELQRQQPVVCEETPSVPVSVGCRSPVIDALYASDYKILQANGYRCLKPDQSYHYCNVSSSNGIPSDPRWDSKVPTSPDIAKYGDRPNGVLYSNEAFDYDLSAREVKEFDEEKFEDIKLNLKKETESLGNNKWRHWKSGLTDSQLQRRRQSNREAQRRRRMRLRLIQMKSLQEQDQVSFEEIMYKRFTPNKRVMVKEAVKAFHLSKSKLKNMLEKRQKVFMDAQIEKSKMETETNPLHVMVPEQNKKGRGCRIKVTPTRQVIVPSMGFPLNVDVTEKAGPTSDNVFFKEMQANSDGSFCSQFSESGHSHLDQNGHENGHSLDAEEQMQQTSSRKRKQFCPRRLLSEAERSNSENVPSLVAAQ